MNEYNSNSSINHIKSSPPLYEVKWFYNGVLFKSGWEVCNYIMKDNNFSTDNELNSHIMNTVKHKLVKVK